MTQLQLHDTIAIAAGFLGEGGVGGGGGEGVLPDIFFHYESTSLPSHKMFSLIFSFFP